MSTESALSEIHEMQEKLKTYKEPPTEMTSLREIKGKLDMLTVGQDTLCEQIRLFRVAMETEIRNIYIRMDNQVSWLLRIEKCLKPKQKKRRGARK